MNEATANNTGLKRTIVPILLALLALMAGVLSWTRFSSPPAPSSATQTRLKQATLLPQLRQLPAFSLSDHQGRPFDNQSLSGQWTLLSFGYTHCPDICPTTLAMFTQLHAYLQERQVSLPYRIGFVSVDPERDSLERLAEYVAYFDPTFLGITGDAQALEKLTKPLGILYRKVETPDSAMGYVMDHSASIVLIDPDGRYHAIFSPPHDALAMAQDIITISNTY